jgi:excisionase family DNA binding protein
MDSHIVRRPDAAAPIEKPEKKMLRARDVSELCDIHLRRVYELTDANLIPHVRFGRAIRYPRAELEEWLRNGGTRQGEVTT